MQLEKNKQNNIKHKEQFQFWNQIYSCMKLLWKGKHLCQNHFFNKVAGVTDFKKIK